MNNEVSLFESLGGKYTEKDGLLYPQIVGQPDEENIFVGKYGQMWQEYMKDTHLERYRHLIRMGRLIQISTKVNEEAYEYLDAIAEQYFQKKLPKGCSSTIEMWQLREQAKQIAEEMMIPEIVHQYY